MSHIFNNTVNGFIYDVEILGNTERKCGGIFKSVGKLVVDLYDKPILNKFGEEQYKVTICSYNEDKTEKHVIDFYIPCQLESFEDVRDILYWDEDRKEYCILKKIGQEKGIGTVAYVDEKIIRTRITDKSSLLLRTFNGTTLVDFGDGINGVLRGKVPTTIEESNESMIDQINNMKKNIEGFNNKIPEINNELYKLKTRTYIMDKFTEFDEWARENEQARIDGYNFMTEDEQRRRDEADSHKKAELSRVEVEKTRVRQEELRQASANLMKETFEEKVEEVNIAKENVENTLDNKITEIDTVVGDSVNQIETTLTNKISEVDSAIDNKINQIETALTNKISEVDSTVQTGIQQANNKVDNKITEINNKVSQLNTSVNNNINTINSTMTSIKNQFNALSPEQATNSEVQLARTDSEGVTHNSLTERLIKIESMQSVLWETIEG